MSSIAGFFQPNTIYSKENEFCIKTIHDMSQALIHRGPDEQSYYYFPQGAFSQNFLLAGYIPGTFPHQIQPVTVTYQDNTYTLLFDGFVSNAEALAMELEIRQISTKNMSLEALLLYSYFSKGTDLCPWNSPGKYTGVTHSIILAWASSQPRDQTQVS